MVSNRTESAFRIEELNYTPDNQLEHVENAVKEYVELLDYLQNPDQELLQFLETPEGQSYKEDLNFHIENLSNLLDRLMFLNSADRIDDAFTVFVEVMQMDDTYFSPLYRALNQRDALYSAPRPRINADISTAPEVLTRNGRRGLLSQDSNGGYTVVNQSYINRLVDLNTTVTTITDDLLIRTESGRRIGGLPIDTPLSLTGERKIMTVMFEGREVDMMYFQAKNDDGVVLGYLAGCYLKGPEIPQEPERVTPSPRPIERDEDDETITETPLSINQILEKVLEFNNGNHRATANGTVTRDYFLRSSTTENLPSGDTGRGTSIVYLTSRNDSIERPEFYLQINNSNPRNMAIGRMRYTDNWFSTKQSFEPITANRQIDANLSNEDALNGVTAAIEALLQSTN